MTNTKTPGQLMQTCLEQATVFPEHHNQGSWLYFRPGSLCGTTGCLAGHAALLGSEDAALALDSGHVSEFSSQIVDDVLVRDETGAEERWSISDLAAELLGLDGDDEDYMFSEYRTLDELWEHAERLFPGEVSYPSEQRQAEILAAGPLLTSRVRSARWAERYTGSSGVVSRDFA